MDNYAILVIPAVLVMLFFKFKYDKDITLMEMGIHLLAILLVSAMVLGITYAVLYSKLGDTEILNGSVTSKYKHTEWCTEYSSCKHYVLRESCSYSYSTDSKGKTTRTKHCVTYKVFDYRYEVDWIVKSTVGSFEIERVNRQGTVMPERFNVIQIGDPASSTNSYMNYLFADEHSLFAEKKFEESYDEEYQKKIPKYPVIYDYYKVDHVVNSTNHNISGYNEYLAEVLKVAGKEKQLNIVIVLYDAYDMQYTDALLSKWRGGKKNDVIMMFGLDDEGKVAKFSSTSFAQGMKNESLHANLRIKALNEVMNLDLVQKMTQLTVSQFNRLPNEEFKYMKYKIEPKKEVVIGGAIVLLCLSIGLGFFMRDNEIA